MADPKQLKDNPVDPFAETEEARFFRRRQARARFYKVFFLSLVGAYAVGAVVWIAYRGWERSREASAAKAVAGSTPARATPERIDLGPVNPPSVTVTAERVLAMKAENERVRQVVADADYLSSKGLVDESAAKLAFQLERTPDVLELKVALSKRYMQQAAYEKALELLADILAVEPGNLDARINLSSAMLALKQYDAAYAAAKWVLDTDPNNLKAHRVAGRVSLEQNLFEQAAEHLRTLINLRAGDQEARLNLAVVYLRLGDFPKAIFHFKLLLEQPDVDSVVYYHFAVCYAQQRQADLALEVLEKALPKVGAGLLLQWGKSDDFKPIRDDEGFVDFQRYLAKEAAGETLPVIQNMPRISLERLNIDGHEEEGADARSGR